MSSGSVSPAGGKSVPSVESMSVLERSRLVLLWSLEKSWCSAREGGSVCEDSEDGWLPGGCFRPDTISFSREGDSPTKLQMEQMESVRLRGKQIPARPGWIRHDWQELNKSGTESLSTKGRHQVPAAACGSLPPAQPSPLGFTVCWGLGCIPASQRMFPFRNAGAEESWAPGGTLRQGSTGRASRASGRRTAAPAPRCWDVPSVFQEFLPWPRLTGMSCRVRTASCTQLWLPLSQRLEYSLKQQEDSTVSKNWAVLLLIPSLKKTKT